MNPFPYINKYFNKSRLHFIGFLLALIIIFNLSASANANSAKVLETIKLHFDGIESPPYCLIPYQKIRRPKIGLALSGGGLRGVTQIGVLKVLVENNIPVDYIVGTSIGALVGGLFASGYSPDEMWRITQSIDWGSVLNDKPQRSTLFLGEKQKINRAFLQFRLDGLKPSLPEAYTPGYKLTDILTKLILDAPYHSQDFTTLPVPLKIIATDLLSGQAVFLKKGDLAEAIRASIAIPLLLTPVEIDSMLLIDGGVMDNIPVKATKKFGADIVIAVDATSPLRTRKEMQMPWEIADQVTTIMQREHDNSQLSKADIVIHFNDMQGNSTDTENIDNFFKEGQKRAAQQIAKLKTVIHRAESDDNNQSYHIARVKISPLPALNIDLPIDTTGHRNIAGNEIYSTLEKTYKLGYFKSVLAEITRVGMDTVLCYRLISNPVLAQVNFYGNTIFPDSVLIKPFEPLMGKVINYKKSRKALESVLRRYRKNGNSLARIEKISFLQKNSTAKIYLSEGKIGKITFYGNKKTKDFVVSREFSLKEGNVFQIEQANDAKNNLYGTGLFNSIILKLRQQQNLWNLQLNLSEKLSHVVRFGAHYDRERNGRAFVEFSNENFLGTGNDLTFHGQYGDRDLVTSVDYRVDRIFKTYLTSRLDFHHKKSKHFAYKNLNGVGEYERQATGGLFTLGQQIKRFGTISGFMRIEEINIRSISGHGYDAGSLVINTIGFNTIIDTRDQVPFPHTGKYHKFSYEVSGGKFLGADISYFKVQNQLATYWTFKKRNTICPKLVWGTSDLTTPFSEQFRIGGEKSFYGLREGELQGRHLILGSFEYRYQLPGKILFDTFLSLRFDAGAVWESVLDVKPEDFINGKGIAVSFKTPLGPISFAYGRASNGKKEMYFTAGYDF